MRKSVHRGAAAIASIAIGLAVLCVSVDVGSVTAGVTSHSTVADNAFGATEHTPVGVYGLVVTPDYGDALRPGDSAKVRIGALDERAVPRAHQDKAGDRVERTVSLPASLTPLDEAGWEMRQTTGGMWTATHVQVFDADTIYTHTADETFGFPVLVGVGEGVEDLVASATLPEQFTSTHGEDHAQIVIGRTVVDIGVYALQVDADLLVPGNQSVLSFDTHPVGVTGTRELRRGEVVTHTIEFPPGLTYVEVPARTTQNGVTIEWSSDGLDVLTRTTRVTSDGVVVAPETVTLPVTVGFGIELFPRVSVGAGLPEDLVSSRGQEFVLLRGSGVTFDSVAVGSEHQIILGEDGTAYAWGANRFNGPVGTGDTVTRPYMTKVVTDVKFDAVAAAGSSSGGGGLTPEGDVYFWGQLPTGGLAFVPTRFETDLKFKQIHLSGRSVVGLTADGTAYSWGLNSSGQLGVGDRSDRDSPTKVATDVRFTSISAGSGFFLGRTESGATYAWGSNVHGQLGLGDFDVRLKPELVELEQEFESITVFGSSVLGLMDDGRLFGWGSNSHGLLGVQETSTVSRPVEVRTDVRFSRLSASSSDSNSVFGFTEAGTVYSWGSNEFGQLSDPAFPSGGFNSRSSPGLVSSDERLVAIMGSGRTSIGLTPDGRVYACGYNPSGQLGVPAGAPTNGFRDVVRFSPVF